MIGRGMRTIRRNPKALIAGVAGVGVGAITASMLSINDYDKLKSDTKQYKTVTSDNKIIEYRYDNKYMYAIIIKDGKIVGIYKQPISAYQKNRTGNYRARYPYYYPTYLTYPPRNYTNYRNTGNNLEIYSN